MKKVLRLLGNKFFLTAVAFAAWLIFFDQNDFFSQRERQKELDATKANITFLNEEISNMEKERAAMNDPQQLEKFARENYRLKKADEDLYVIEKSK